MSDTLISVGLPQPSTLPARHPDTPAKIRDAAQQFEALLIGQILQSVSESAGWSGADKDSASSCALGFAQEQLASVMSKSGGFGLSQLITQGLEQTRPPQP